MTRTCGRSLTLMIGWSADRGCARALVCSGACCSISEADQLVVVRPNQCSAACDHHRKQGDHRQQDHVAVFFANSHAGKTREMAVGSGPDGAANDRRLAAGRAGIGRVSAPKARQFRSRKHPAIVDGVKFGRKRRQRDRGAREIMPRFGL